MLRGMETDRFVTPWQGAMPNCRMRSGLCDDNTGFAPSEGRTVLCVPQTQTNSREVAVHLLH